MRVLVVCLLLSLLVACSDPASQAHDIGYPQLKTDAQQMLVDCQSKYGSFLTIPKEDWPDSIDDLEPLEVRMHMFGVLVITEQVEDAETGIYIVTYGDEAEINNPSAGGGLTYKTIEPGLHLAHLKTQLASSGR